MAVKQKTVVKKTVAKKTAGKKAVTKQKSEAIAHAIGRRKTAIARVYLYKGKGAVVVNGKPVDQYFGSTAVYSEVAILPLKVTETLKEFDLKVTVRGGGLTGQAGAVSLAIARALCMHELKTNPFAEKVEDDSDEGEGTETGRPWRMKLKTNGLLTRDARIVERKLYGFRKARKKEQYSKR